MTLESHIYGWDTASTFPFFTSFSRMIVFFIIFLIASGGYLLLLFKNQTALLDNTIQYRNPRLALVAFMGFGLFACFSNFIFGFASLVVPSPSLAFQVGLYIASYYVLYPVNQMLGKDSFKNIWNTIYGILRRLFPTIPDFDTADRRAVEYLRRQRMKIFSSLKSQYVNI